MPTRKISEREKLTIWSRTATDEELEEAHEILSIERRVRAASKPGPNPGRRTRTSAKPKDAVPGPPNPPKPANDNPQG